MGKKIHSLMLFFLFLIGIGIGLISRAWQVKKARPISFSPQQPSFTLKPPSDALKGNLLLIKGNVKKEPRDKEEFEEVNVEEEILQGEKLATGKKSQTTVEFPGFVRVNLGSNTAIGFINLIPANFLVSQASGSVSYKLLQDNAPISVRSLHALLTFDSSASENKVLAKPGSYSGESEVTVKEEEVTIKVLSGKAKLALVDLDNKTHIWEFEKGDEISVDDTKRRVEIE